MKGEGRQCVSSNNWKQTHKGHTHRGNRGLCDVTVLQVHIQVNGEERNIRIVYKGYLTISANRCKFASNNGMRLRTNDTYLHQDEHSLCLAAKNRGMV